MKKYLLIVVFLLFLMVIGIVSAQEDEDIPVVAILKFGDVDALNLSEKGAIDALTAYGYEDGENIEYIIGQAEFDINIARDLVSFAIDSGADVIVAISTPIAIAAVELTNEMENPPAVFFNTVTSPYAAGFAQSPCIKPTNVTGSQALPPYNLIFPILLDINPSIETVGILYNDAEANSVLSVEIIREVAQTLGIDIFAQSVPNRNVVIPAAESMLMSGIDAFFIPTDSTVVSAIPELSQAAEIAGIPLVTVTSSEVYNGATVGIGLDYYQEGIDVARLVFNYLNNELDVATTAINLQTGLITAVNLDAAQSQGIDLNTEFMEMVDFIIEDGESSEKLPELEVMSLEDRMEADSAFLANLDCTPERIAEEQDALDNEE